MFRATVLLIAWLIAAPAWAFLPGQPVGMLNPQVQPANASAGLPAVDDNLGAAGYPIAGGVCAEWGHQVPCNNHYSTVRASTKYVSASDGLFTSVPANVFALGSNTGGSIEEARINLALWSRDLTQSGTWIAVTMTVAKNAVGIDGAANSASTLTATSPAGTILQSLTQASAAYTYTVYVKGVTVTGAIQVADYPVLTPAFTTLSSSNCFNPAGTGVAPTSGQTGFLRCTVTATSLNPVIGFKFANSGDSIIVDFNQLEAGSNGTSPCLTTVATCTRSADNIQAAGPLLTALQLANAGIIFQTTGMQNGITAGLVTVGSLNMFADVNNQLFSSNGSTNLFGPTLANWPNLQKSGFSWAATPSRFLVINNGTVSTTTDTKQTSAGPYYIGSNTGASAYLNGLLVRNTVVSGALSTTQLKALTQ
jgi:hypothetical protein